MVTQDIKDWILSFWLMLLNNAQFYAVGNRGGVEVLIADFASHKFDAHWHETWSIGAVITGAHDNSPKGNGDGVVTSGQVSLLAPGEVHAGKVLGSDNCKYVMFYVQETELSKAFEQFEQRIPSISHMAVNSPELHQELVQCAMQLAEPSSTMFDIEVSWARCMGLLVERLSQIVIADDLSPKVEDFRKLIKARDYLEAHYNELITLDHLAHEANLSKFHLCRQFSRVFNISPNKYLRQLRLLKAKQLIGNGYPIASAAVACGFSDQSHLGRQFKATFGISPKKYAAEFK